MTGPMLIWKLDNGQIVTDTTLSLETMNGLGQKAGF